MQTVSDLFKSKIKEASREFECKITIGDNIYTNEDLVDIKISNGIPGDGFMIGATPSATLDLTLLNRGDTIYSTNQIKIEIGLNIGSKFEYLLMGLFNIDEVEKTDYTVKFTAYDNMIKFETAYFSSLGTSPTLQQVVNELASKTGVQFTGTLPAYNVKKLEGFTCREVLGYVASLCGGNALITRDGKFTIVIPKDVGYIITPDNYIPPFNLEEVKYKVGKVSCQVGEEVLSKGSLGTDSMELQFENPWITATILTDIYNKLNGFNYLGYSLKWQGDISLDIGDIVSVTDIRGVVRKLPILNQELNYIGGLTSTISAKGETKNKNSFNSSGSIGKKVERVVTELAIVNKALIDVAHIGDLTANNITVGTINGGSAILQDILTNFIAGENGQLVNLTSKNAVLDKALIKEGIAAKMQIGDLQAGIISTNKFSISSTDGGLNIVGPTMQFKDKNNKVRIQMGQDTQGNFNFILRGADGTTILIDHTGIKEKAIADDLIKSNMVAADAIGEKQINYSSLITGLNKDDNTSLIKASKVAIDLTGQSLEVAFNSLKSNVDNMEIGGRNLVLNSRCNTFTHWEMTDDINFKPYAEDGIPKGFLCKGTSNGNHIRTEINNRIEGDTEYTLTYYQKNTVASKVWVGVYYNSYSYIPLVNYDTKVYLDFTKITVTFRTPKEGNNFNLRIYMYSQTETIFKDIKLEKGNKSTDWTPAPEDIDQVTQSLQTQITVAQGKIEGLIKDTTITKGDITTLKDNYTSITATVNGLNSTVASHTSSISTINTRVTNTESSITQLNNSITNKVWQTDIDKSISKIEIGGRNLLINSPSEDNKIKQTASKDDGYVIYYNIYCNLEKGVEYIVSGKTDGKWVNKHDPQNPNPDVVTIWLTDGTSEHYLLSIDKPFKVNNTKKFLLRLNVYRTGTTHNFWDIKIEKGNKVTTYTKAPEDVDRAILVVSKEVTTVKEKAASLETSLNSITSKVTNLESTTSTINGKVNAQETRLQSTEQKVTATGVITTITEAINKGTNSLTTMQFILDRNGATIKNGALKILNNAGESVLHGDTTGNLIIRGVFEQFQNGVKSVDIKNNAVNLYDWSRDGDLVGGMIAVVGDADGRGKTMLYSDQGNPLLVGYCDANRENYYGVVVIDDTKQANGNQTVVGLYDHMAFFDYQALHFYGLDHTIPLGKITVADSNNTLNILGKQNYSSVRIGEMTTNANTYQGFANFDIKGLHVWGNISCSGSKSRMVSTKNYDGVKLNAYETADCYFGDIGEGTIGEDGLCYVYIDPLLLETINTKCTYQVFVQAYGDGKAYPIERKETFFVIKGTPGLKFGWEFKAKQRGYETERLEREKLELSEQDSGESFLDYIDKEPDYDDFAIKYLKDYEKELIENG